MPDFKRRKTAPTLGVPVALTSGQGPERFARAAELAALAEEAGFARVWTNELYTHSATVGMAVAAQATRQAEIGSCIAYGVGRSPLVWTAEARDLDALSGGRLILGLGNGTRRMISDWHGADGDAPAVRMEELVDVLRKLWRLDLGPVEHEGRFYRVKVAPTVAMEPPLRERLPIYLAGVNPRMVEVTGRVGDGVIGHPMATPQYVAEVMHAAVADGAALRDRDPAEIETVAMVMCSLHVDRSVARRELAIAIAGYAGSRVYDAIVALHGWQAEVEVVRAAMRRGDLDGMADAVSDEMLDTIGIAGTPDELPGALERYVGVVDHVILTPPPWGPTPERMEEIVRAVIASVPVGAAA